MIHQILERSDDPASRCYLQKSPSQLPSASWTQHLCTGKIITKSFTWTTAITGRPHPIGSLPSASHFTPPPPRPLISIHVFSESLTTDHLTVGWNTATTGRYGRKGWSRSTTILYSPPPFISTLGMTVFKSRPDHQKMPKGRRHTFSPV